MFNLKNKYQTYKFCITQFLKGNKPYKYKNDTLFNNQYIIKNGKRLYLKNLNKGKYFLIETNGKKSKENFIRVIRNNKVSYFHNYYRKGKLRTNNYTFIKIKNGITYITRLFFNTENKYKKYYTNKA